MGKKGMEKDKIKGVILILKLKNGKGSIKEYDEYEELKFEGEYLMSKEIKRKGKEFHEKKLIFEEEYLNGKEYNWIIGKLKFETEKEKNIFLMVN